MTFFVAPLGAFGGIEIIEDWRMTDTVEDWSGVRSPSRALRRRKRGFPQRIVYRQVPKKGAVKMGNRVFVHPEIARQLRSEIDRMRSELKP